MNIKIFGSLFFKIDSNDVLIDHIIVCIFDLLKKHILTLVSTNENQINIYKDIKSLIFQCVNKRYLDLENPSYAMKNIICDCISILIISGITHSWENCIEELILNAENNKNNKPELIYICLRSISDCDLIMNFMKEDDNDDYWDDTLNLKKQKKLEIKDKLISKTEIIFNYINNVYMEINGYEKNLKKRIMKAIVDIIIFWTKLKLNILTNEKSISNIIMDFIQQAIKEESAENVTILKSLAELFNNAIISSQNCRLYEFYGKIEENDDSIEETLEKINNNINIEEKISIEKWLNFILDILVRYKGINNKNIEVLWALSKIFSSILENCIFLFFDLKNQRNVFVFNLLEHLISEKRIISWMFFSTIENMMNFITDYFRFYSYNEKQKESFKELLLNILLNIMNNCSYSKLEENDFSQLQKDILFLNNESNWSTEKKNYINGDDVDFSIDDIDITEYRNNAEYTLCSIYLIFKSGFNSAEYEIIPINKILSLINLNIVNNNQINESDLIKLDTLLFTLKSFIKCLNDESSSLIIKSITDFINQLINSPYIQNIRIFIDYLLLINQFSAFLIKDEEIFKNIIANLLLVTQNINNNQLLLDSCYIVMCNLCRELKNNISHIEYFSAFLERYKILVNHYSINNNLQLENLIRSMFYSLGINENNEDNNGMLNNHDNELVSQILEIIKPFIFKNFFEKIRDISIIKKNIIKSYFLYKEIFYHISLCNKKIRSYMLNYFISNTINDLIELNEDSQSINKDKIFDVFPNDEEIINSVVEFYMSISFNIVDDCPQLIPKINELFVKMLKKSLNFFKVIEFFECFYKYILKNIKETDENYIGINKYIFDNFMLIMKLSINYINSKININEETFNRINILLSTGIEVFPNVYLTEMNVIIFNNIITVIQFIFNLIDFSSKEKRKEINDKFISNIIKCLTELLNNNIIKLLSNFIQMDQRKELIMNILYKTFKLLNIKESGDLSIQILSLLYFQMISFDNNLFINFFSQLLISTEIFNDFHINNIIKYIKSYYQNKNNIVDFFGEIINILVSKKELDCLEFYFYRLNTKKP